jgi:argininosuccinate lyase
MAKKKTSKKTKGKKSKGKKAKKPAAKTPARSRPKTPKRPSKLWGGRFRKKTHPAVERLTESISFDRRLYRHDIQGSIAHAAMLARVKVITETDKRKILSGLRAIEKDIEDGKFEFKIENEDIHTAIELALVQKIGSVAKKLHAGRSRNDQMALDLRLWMRDEIIHIEEQVCHLQENILTHAEDTVDVPMAAFTHLQHAQPIPLAHHLLAYVEMLERDSERLLGCYARVNELPLGSGAVAGTSIPTDREFMARLLGFDTITHNSVDAVSNRDFCMEFLTTLSILAVHLSRLAEEWTWWASPEFGFLHIDEAFCTGSSILPQKKNPDALELIRGKTGRVFGDLMQMLTVMKGLPLSYNRDLQEDKDAIFNAADTIRLSLDALVPLVENVTFIKERIAATTERDLIDATSLAEYLVMKKVPFRDAHRIVGKLVAQCLDQRIALQDLELPRFQEASSKIDQDVYEVLGIDNCLRRYRGVGSANPRSVRRELTRWRRLFEE